MTGRVQAIAAQKERLDQLRPLSREALEKLERYYDIEFTYSSNAIEGNTLSPVETTLVIEQGVTIAGKPLKDHLEALDHYDAIRYVRELARHNDRPAYILALQEAQAGVGTASFLALLYERLEATLAEYIATLAS